MSFRIKDNILNNKYIYFFTEPAICLIYFSIKCTAIFELN